MPLRRFCRALDLVDDEALIAAYEAWHAPGQVWPEVLDFIRAQGVVAMELWRAGDHVTMIIEAEEDYPRPAPIPARVDEWEAFMLQFQKPLPQATPENKWVLMTKIFDLPSKGGEG